MNATAEEPIIKLEDFNESTEQNARNNYLFRNGSLRYDLNKKNYFWTDTVNQNISNN